MEEVDTTGAAPTTNIADRKTVLSTDVAEKGADRDLLFKNVPEKDNYYIKVPAILARTTKLLFLHLISILSIELTKAIIIQ